VQQRVTASFRRADSGALHIRKATRPETELVAIYQALDLDPLPVKCAKELHVTQIDPPYNRVVPYDVFLISYLLKLMMFYIFMLNMG
jgi:hypothetical protein